MQVYFQLPVAESPFYRRVLGLGELWERVEAPFARCV